MSSVLYCALNITPHKFPKAGGGAWGGGRSASPPKNTGRTAFWLWSVSFRFFSFVPCYCSSRCCSSFFLFLCLASSVLYCALNIASYKFLKAGGGHGGEGAAPPPQRTQEEQRSGFDPFRFASFPLCLVLVVLVVVLPSCFLFLCLVSSVLYCALNIAPHKFPKAGGGAWGGGRSASPPKNTGRTAFWPWSVSIRFFSFVPCYCCSRCCSSFFFLFLCLVSSVLYCALNITPHKFLKAGGGHGGEGAAPPPQRTQEEHRSGFDPFRFASFPLCLVIVVLVVVLPSSFLFLCLVSSVLYCALNITPHKFPKAGGGRWGAWGGGRSASPPKNTGRTSFWLWSVSFRFFSFLPCYCCSRCCSSFLFLVLVSGVVCLVLCLKHYPT